MSETLKSAMRAAVLRQLAPLVKLLLEAGLGAEEFAALARVAFVRAAHERGGIHTKPNHSQIATLTGLTRVKVAEILRSESVAPESSERGKQRAERVLAGWWNDPTFQTRTGGPAILPVRGARRSFAALCQRYSGALEPARILEELLRVRAVERLPGDRVKALSRTYATVRWSAEGIEAVGEQLSEHCASLAHNLREPARPLFVQRIVNSQLDPAYARVVRPHLEEQASAFVESMARALNDPLYTARSSGPDGEAMRLGLAVYMFEDAATRIEAATPDAPARDRGTGRTVRRGRRTRR